MDSTFSRARSGLMTQAKSAETGHPSARGDHPLQGFLQDLPGDPLFGFLLVHPLIRDAAFGSHGRLVLYRLQRFAVIGEAVGD